MCTCFAVYKNEPIYAMNFDFWKTESRIRIDDSSSFFYEIKANNEYLETAGMNKHGFFGNFQGNLSDKHQNITPDANCIKIEKLYRESLHSAKSIKDFYNILDCKTVVYPPTPPEYNKNHNMFADKDGNSLILETASKKNDITTINDKFLVMTNFPVGQFKGVNYKNAFGAGSDRYIKAYDYLLQHDTVDLMNAFEILKDTAQIEDAWETLISMVFLPNKSTVYIAVKRNFNKIFKVNINNRVLESFQGFEKSISMKLNNSGIELKSLENLL